MSTITERCGGHLATAAVALALWFGTLALWTAASDPGRVLVLAPRRAAITAALHADARLLAVDGVVSIVSAKPNGGQRRGFVGDLYAGGAWLVLPGVAGGCVTVGEEQ